MSATFDTLSATKALKGAGMTDASAEAIVSIVRQSSELPALHHLATKDDLEKTALGLKLFVASSVLGGAGVIVLAQIVLRVLRISP